MEPKEVAAVTDTGMDTNTVIIMDMGTIAITAIK